MTTVVAALCVALPVLVVVSFVITGVSDAWNHLLETLLGRYALNSLLLSALVAIGVVILGFGVRLLLLTCFQLSRLLAKA